MDNARRSQLMDVGDVKDLLTDLVDVLQQDPKMLAVKRLIQCFNEMQNNNENLLSTILEKLILAINATIETISINDLNDLLFDLIQILQEEPTGLAMKRVLQCIFNMVQNKNVNLSPRIFNKLIFTMIAASENGILASTKEHSQLVANVLACVQLQVTKFPSAESKLWLDQLWSLSLNGEQVHPFAGHILVQFIDDFVRDIGLDRCPELLTVIQYLLQSKDINDRQAALFLMHKLEGIFNIVNSVGNAIKCPHQQWSDYIAALESLEKQQLPLNLISLLKNLETANDFFHWQSILYLRLLQSENILVVYETVKFIVNHLDMSHLTEWKLMDQFLIATNSTQLYNVDDGDDDRSSPLSNGFVSTSELESFLEALVNVPWKWQSVPLHEWLKSLPKEEEDHFPCISNELMFSLASRVQRIKSKEIKNQAQDLVIQIFEVTLDNLNLKDYLLFIGMMYRKSNNYSDHDRLEDKIIKCDNFQMHIEYFNEALWHIIFNQRMEEYDIISALIEKLEMLPKDQHGDLQLLIISEATYRGSQEMFHFYYNEYDVDIALVFHGDNLTELCSHLIDKLMWTTDHELEFIVKLSTDLFVHNQIKKWTDIEMLGLKPLELLNQGGFKTYVLLEQFYGRMNGRFQDENVFSAFVSLLKTFPFYMRAKNIGNYASKHMSIKDQNTLAVDIINKHIKFNTDVILGLLHSKVKVPLHQILQGIIHNTNHSEDEWIEETYLNSVCVEAIRNSFMSNAARQSERFVKLIGDQLLLMNKELSESQPHYLINSREHRTKFSIALALLYLEKKYICSDQLWSTLFSSNEQFNITLMYERIVAGALRDLGVLLERLQSMSTLGISQQISLLSVTHIFLVQKEKDTLNYEQVQNIFTLLLNPSIGKNVEVGKFAKLILNQLITMCRDKGYKIPIVKNLLASVEVNLANISAGPQLEARLLLPGIPYTTTEGYWAFYMSNTKPRHLSGDELLKVKQFRKAIKLASIETNPAKENNSYPKSDIYTQPDLESQYISNNNADLVVVAVFINNLASLDELMQTCRALGIQTLIVNDSINLSPITDDTLNIVKLKLETLNQYLRMQKLKNYNIVATRNTAKNSEFVDFTFAKRTILLLGHEQDEMAENLKCVLNNTVEIPQKEFQYAQKLLIFKYYKQYSENTTNDLPFNYLKL